MTLNAGTTCNTDPTTPIHGKLLVALGAMSAFGPVTTDIYLPSLPQAAAALNTTPTGIQSSLTICLLGVAAGQLTAGPLSDNRGRRGLLLIAMTVFMLSSALCSIAGNIATLDLFRLLQGSAGGAGIAICFAIVRDLCAGSAAARAYSILLATSLIALILAPTIGGSFSSRTPSAARNPLRDCIFQCASAGHSRAAARRAGRFGDGFQTLWVTGAWLGRCWCSALWVVLAASEPTHNILVDAEIVAILRTLTFLDINGQKAVFAIQAHTKAFTPQSPTPTWTNWSARTLPTANTNPTDAADNDVALPVEALTPRSTHPVGKPNGPTRSRCCTHTYL
jgi:MFS family permease